MAEDSSRYCTLIDKLGESNDKNKDYKKVFMLLSKLCMLSLLTKRVTFLLPCGAALTKLEKMTAAQQRDQFKRHIIGGAFEKKELEGKDRVYTRMTIDKSKRIAYTVAGKGASLTIGNVKVGKVAVKVEGKTKAGKKIPIGIAYEVADLLPTPGEEVPLRPRKGKQMPAPMEGGQSPLEMLVSHEVDHLLNMKGNDLRWAIVEQYRNSWPLSVFGIDSEYSWFNWAVASLVSFLKEEIPEFYWVYSPYLGLDPFATLDLLFEYHVKDSYCRYILPDDLVHRWVNSKWFLYSDPALLQSSFTYLAGGGGQRGGRHLSNIISLDYALADRYVAAGKEAIGEYIRYHNPEKLREGIVKVYKKVYEEPNILLGETRAIYKQVDKEPFVVGLHNDLRRFMDSRFRYHSDFDSLYPSFLNCAGCKPNRGFLSGLFSGGGSRRSNAAWTILSFLQYDPYTLTVDLNGSDKWRFPIEILEEFVNSPYFLYFSILDKPSHKEFKYQSAKSAPSFEPLEVRVKTEPGPEYMGFEFEDVSDFAARPVSRKVDDSRNRSQYSSLAASMARNFTGGAIMM